MTRRWALKVLFRHPSLTPHCKSLLAFEAHRYSLIERMPNCENATLLEIKTWIGRVCSFYLAGYLLNFLIYLSNFHWIFKMSVISSMSRVNWFDTQHWNMDFCLFWPLIRIARSPYRTNSNNRPHISNCHEIMLRDNMSVSRIEPTKL